MASGRVVQLVTTLDLGGAQLVAMDLARRLSGLGYESHLLSGPEGALRSEAWATSDIVCRILPRLRRRIAPVSDLIALYQLYRYFRKHDVDIVHTHSSKAGVLGRLAARLAGVPVVVHSVHGWSFHRGQWAPVQKLFVLIERVAARFCTRLVAVSDSCVSQGLSANVGHPQLYERIYCGADEEDFARPGDGALVLRQFGFPAQGRLVVNVSCLKRQKAPVDFITAAADVHQRVPGARFVLVGDGVLRRKARTRISALGLNSYARMTGWRKDAASIISAAEVVVLTSRWEGLPLVTVEAMLAGKPVVATRVDGTVEAVVDGETGFLVDPGDTASIGERVSWLLRNRHVAGRMGAAGRERARKLFRRSEMAERVDAMYRRCRAEREAFQDGRRGSPRVRPR